MARLQPREPLPLVTVPPGALVARQGEPSPRPLVVVAGALRESRVSADGRELVLDLLGPGDLAVSPDGGAAPGTVRAMRTSRLREASLTELPGLATVREHRRLTLACDLAWLDVASRLERRLDDLADRFGREASGGIMIDLFLRQEDLAALVGATRESANRALRGLVERGQLRMPRRGRYVVRPPLRSVG